jgi:glucose-6-phosphate 1-dehydrogenase
VDGGDSTTVVVFGASGDLTRRKLVPALYNLYKKGQLPNGTRVVGFAYRACSSEEFRAFALEGVREFSAATFDGATWDAFARNLHYVTGDFSVPGDYRRLHAFIDELEAVRRTASTIWRPRRASTRRSRNAWGRKACLTRVKATEGLSSRSRSGGIWHRRRH